MKIITSIVCIFSVLGFIGCSGITVVKPTPEQMRLEAKSVARTGTYFAFRQLDKNKPEKLKADAKALKDGINSIDWNKPINSQSATNILTSQLRGDALILFQFATDLINAHVDTGTSVTLTGDSLLITKAIFDGIVEGCDLAIASA